MRVNTALAGWSIAAALVSMAAPAMAGTATGTLSVSATVAATCNVSSGSIDFGTYTPSSDANQTSAVSVTCTAGTNYTVELGAGGNPSGQARRMAGAGSHLTYELYSDTGRSVIWNDSNKVAGTGSGSAQSILVYGRIPSGQSVPAGSYADSVQILVTY